MPAAPIGSSAPPAAPRPLTARARHRSWNEPRVRFLWLAALVLLAAAVYVGLIQTTQWRHDMRLVRYGTPVTAMVVEADGASHAGPEFSPPVSVKLKYELNGKPYTVSGIVEAGDGPRYVSPKRPLAIRVDPAHPTDWTARDHPTSLVRELLGAGLILVVVLVLLLLALLARQRVLRLWRDGQALAAVVVQTAHSALAPRSRAVRCTLSDHSDKRLITIFIPHAIAQLAPGDTLYLIVPPNRPHRALPAMLYQE
jgi:hypothetical protein